LGARHGFWDNYFFGTALPHHLNMEGELMPDELLVLGSSSGVPTQRRFASAYALSVAGKLFLLDCGAPVSNLLYQYGLDPLDVQAVFLSHWHMDHVAGLGLFLTQNHLNERPGSLAVYGPRGTHGKIRRLLTDSFVMPYELNYQLDVTNIKPNKKYKEGLIRVTYFKTQHLERSRYKTRFGRKAVSCGMIINGPGWRLVYSGDLRSSKELAPHIAGCDLLIHEMAHARPDDVAEFAADAQVPHVLISHLGPEYDEAPEKIVQAFDDRYPGQLTIAEDGIKVQLSKSSE
jgi:ribonuclease Z